MAHFLLRDYSIRNAITATDLLTDDTNCTSTSVVVVQRLLLTDNKSSGWCRDDSRPYHLGQVSEDGPHDRTDHTPVRTGRALRNRGPSDQRLVPQCSTPEQCQARGGLCRAVRTVGPPCSVVRSESGCGPSALRLRPTPCRYSSSVAVRSALWTALRSRSLN